MSPADVAFSHVSPVPWCSRHRHGYVRYLILHGSARHLIPDELSPARQCTATEVVFTGKNVAFEENFRKTMRTPDVAAGMIVDILLASTREKDGGEFHAVEGGRHPW
jgi:hypothetical protein